MDGLVLLQKVGVGLSIFLACALGMPMPEEITLISLGMLVAAKQISVYQAIFPSVGGIMVGDMVLYSLGRFFGPRVFQLRLLRNAMSKDRVKFVEGFMHKSGRGVCFFGRFLFGFRIVIFTAVGALGIKPQVFLLCDMLAALLEVGFWLFLGIWLGNFIDVLAHIEQLKKFFMLIVGSFFLFYIVWQVIRRHRHFNIGD